RELVRRGVRAVVLDVRRSPAVAFPELRTVDSVALDVRDRVALRAALERLNARSILHLAALVGAAAEADPVRAFEVNAVGSAALLEAALELRLERVVALSTKGVLGPLEARYLHPHYEPVPEDLEPRPRSIYETTKLAVEALVRRARGLGLSAAAVRLATTWGPGKSAESHAGFSVHSDILAAALAGRSSSLALHPAQGHDLVYYADVARGLVDLTLAPVLRHPVYHLGSDRITTLGEFAAAVERAFPGVRVALGSELAGGRACRLSIERAWADAGYAPAYDVAAALADARAIAAFVG
ncbi:MAG TPA: NAD(P)-dependent oxidoreductase, partial [Candidatus Limnocylindrales bacterium]|nr:NAD(P)-dependent oxidoreductase [Candidatus Limnocylindrales bacterium]